MAEHYNTANAPARVRKPQDKSHAEGSVRFAEAWIIVFRISLIVHVEWNNWQTDKVNRLRNSAHFSDSNTTFGDMEYFEDCKLGKSQILRLLM